MKTSTLRGIFVSLSLSPFGSLSLSPLHRDNDGGCILEGCCSVCHSRLIFCCSWSLHLQARVTLQGLHTCDTFSRHLRFLVLDIGPFYGLLRAPEPLGSAMAEVDAENGSFEAVSPSSRSGAPESGQAISGLAKILQDHGVQHSLAKHLLDEGWDTQSFRHVVCTASEFDGVLVEMFGGTAVPLMQRSKLRAVWTALQQPTPGPMLSSEASGTAQKSNPGWSEAAKVASLKKAFLSAYPSEILNASNTPSLRLLSTAVDAEVKKDWSWIPWKGRMSQQMFEDSQLNKPAKRARIETLQLSDLLLDEPPQIDINDATMGISMVRRLLEVHDNALALAGTAHLARLKAYSAKFLCLVSQRFPPETGLRPPSILEAQQADKHLWSCIYQLVIEKSWKLNDAIYEYTEIRGDMASWLQPRAKVTSALPRRPHGPGGKDHRTTIATPGKGSGKGKGKPRGSSKGTQKGGSVQWVREFKDGGQVKRLCIAWQLGKCQRGSSCEFIHGCAFPKSDGSPCLSKDHGAVQHTDKAH